MISPVTADDPAPIQGTSMISIFAPAGIGEVVAGTDLATAIITAAEADPHGPLQDGDIVVITSKIISKAEGRIEPASQRAELITSESRRTVARRGETRIVRSDLLAVTHRQLALRRYRGRRERTGEVRC